jgi:hypothetical protein
MAMFHFHIHENGQTTTDEEGREFSDPSKAREEAVATGTAIAREVFLSSGKASARRVIVDVHRGDVPFLKVSISLDIEQNMDDDAAVARQPGRIPEGC